MEKDRQIEILNQVIFYLSNEKLLFTKGICEVITYLSEIGYITELECFIIKQLMKLKKPNKSSRTKYVKFTKNPHWLNGLYWWSPIYEAPETRQIRIDYLTEVVENLK